MLWDDCSSFAGPRETTSFGSSLLGARTAQKRGKTRKNPDMRKHYDFSTAKRGPILAPSPGKTRITIRLDDDVLDWFRERTNSAGGGNYQTQINDALRAFVQERKKPLETVLRRVVREELRRAHGER
jgi:uncharacterized protein (DUF4415 family)